MKVLMVNKFLHPNGGSETYIFKLGEQLKREGHEVQYFGMEHEGRCVGNDLELYTADMDFHTGKLQKLLYPFKIIYSTEARKKMKAVLETFEPDVVHVNNFNFQLTPSVLLAVEEYRKKRNKTVKLVYTAHDSQLVCPNHLMQNPVTGQRCQECLGKNSFSCVKNRCIHGSGAKSILAYAEHELYKRLHVYRLFDIIICPSNFMKRVLDTDSVLKEKTRIIRNFVDADVKKQMEKEDYILYFGRLSKEKGIDTLLEVCRELKEIPFVFAGSGPMEEQVNQCHNIRNMGFLNGKELYEVIAKARFTVFPSECFENCPFTVMESQLCGTPVIASNLGGIPELIKENITGQLFECGNARELKDKIETLWNDRAKQNEWAENCRKAEFDSLLLYTNKIISLYKEK